MRRMSPGEKERWSSDLRRGPARDEEEFGFQTSGFSRGGNSQAIVGMTKRPVVQSRFV